MSDCVDVRIHRSQFPGTVANELVNCLRARQLNHKFLYESNRQANLWLAIHNGYSAYRIDSNTRSIYVKMFSRLADSLGSGAVTLISIGCGSGHKDAELVKILSDRGCSLDYLACDVSPGLTIAAGDVVREAVPGIAVSRMVFDLLSDSDPLRNLETGRHDDAPRIVAAFGMVPNFTPDELFPRIRNALLIGGKLIISVNLSGDGALESVLPQYDNQGTREWLLAFVRDLGLHADPGDLQFSIESDQRFTSLKRIEANLTLSDAQAVTIGAESIHFGFEDRLRVFYSYRYTIDQLVAVLAHYSLRIADREISTSGEEGVFVIEAA